MTRVRMSSIVLYTCARLHASIDITAYSSLQILSGGRLNGSMTLGVPGVSLSHTCNIFASRVGDRQYVRVQRVDIIVFWARTSLHGPCYTSARPIVQLMDLQSIFTCMQSRWKLSTGPQRRMRIRRA